MKIPKQLSKQRFVICNSAKAPTEKDWPNTANYSYDVMQEKNELIYGVLCGYNNLVVIDCDTKHIEEKFLALPEFRKTFTVRSAGKKLGHFYFYVENTLDVPETFRVKNSKKESLFDFQGTGTQVIGPNSKLLNGKEYQLVNDTPISTIDYNFLVEICKNIDPDIAVLENKSKDKKDVINTEFDPVCKLIKQHIKIVDLLPQQDRNKNPTMCPLGHPSNGEACFSHTGNVWNCFNCGKSGTIFQLYQQMHNVDFKTAKQALIEKAGLSENIQMKILKFYHDPKTKHKAIELMANEFIKLNRVHTLRNDKDPEMWIYKDGIYIPHARTYIHEYCEQLLGSFYQSKFVKKVVDKIIAKTYTEPDSFFKNEDIELVPLQNGILNTSSRDLLSYDPKYKFFNKLPINYDPKIKADATLKFLSDILSDEKDLLCVQELFGYLLYREYKFEKAWMFLGKGRNGKGKLLSLMETFLGKTNVCNVSLQELERGGFTTQRLFNKMANLSGDLSKTGLTDTGLFKNLTGRDLLTADRKYLSEITFKNYAKMVFAANDLPETNDESDGFLDRWIILDFKWKFVPEPTKPHHKKIDTSIVEKISTPKEMTGLLNWALDGLQRLIENNDFSVSTSTEEVKKIWLRKSSSFAAFLADTVKKSYIPDAFIKTDTLSTAYSSYCEKHKLVPVTSQKITQQMNKFGSQKQHKQVNGSRNYVWLNVAFKSEEEELIALNTQVHNAVTEVELEDI